MMTPPPIESKWEVNQEGKIISIAWLMWLNSVYNNNSIRTQITTVAPSSGGAGALPATPKGYATLNVNGIDRKIPYY